MNNELLRRLERGDLVVLNAAESAATEVGDRVHQLPTEVGSSNDSAHISEGEHGIVTRIVGTVAFVFFSSGARVMVETRALVVVGRPLPQSALTTLLASRTVVSASS